MLKKIIYKNQLFAKTDCLNFSLNFLLKGEMSMDEYNRNSGIDRGDGSREPNFTLVPVPVDSEKYEKNKASVSFWKKLLSYFAVGVLSSVVTIAIIFGFNFVNGKINNEQRPDSQEFSRHVDGDSRQYTPTYFKDTSEYTVADIAEKLAPTIVGVVNYQETQNFFGFPSTDMASGSGSGVIYKKVGDNAFIITNYHVIEKANRVEVELASGDRTEAEVVGVDPLTDLAVLKIPANLVDEVAPFGDSDALRPGDEVIAIGNPLGLEFSRTVTKGIVSAVNREVTVNTAAGEWTLEVIQTDAAINPGNSGGALINSVGEVIGINSLKISQEGVEGLGFAIPSNDVIPIVEELIEHGEIKRPFIGIQMINITDIHPIYKQNMFGGIEKGIVIYEVQPGSPAALAGLKQYDIIVGINGEEVNNTTEFRQYLYKHVKPGDTIKIEFYRDGKRQAVDVKTVANN